MAKFINCFSFIAFSSCIWVVILAYLVMQSLNEFSQRQIGVLYYYQTMPQGTREKMDKDEIEQHSWEGRKIFMIIHGYTESSNRQWVQNMTQVILKTTPSAVVLQVDHRNLLHFSRPTMSVNIDLIAKDIASILLSLEEACNIRFSDVHIIGFSIGGRIAGVVPSFLPKGKKIGRITGLDPSFPWQPTNDPRNYLEDSDADVVVVVRTSSYGMKLPQVSLDFTVNGGYIQPGCERSIFLSMLQTICSHYRSLNLYMEALERGPEAFLGCVCDSFQAYNDQTCECLEKNTFGIHTNTSSKGKFFVKTASTAPFSIT